MRTHTHTHTGICTIEHTACTKLNLHAHTILQAVWLWGHLWWKLLMPAFLCTLYKCVFFLLPLLVRQNGKGPTELFLTTRDLAISKQILFNIQKRSMFFFFWNKADCQHSVPSWNVLYDLYCLMKISVFFNLVCILILFQNSGSQLSFRVVLLLFVFVF